MPLHIKVDKPVFQISPLFTSDDVKKVEWVVSKFQNNESLETAREVSKEVFIRSKCFVDKDEVITDICKSLIKRNYIYRSYEKSVKDREKIYYTEVGRGIAIPHGNTSEVKKSCISVTILKHPMKWENEEVEFVFIVSLRDEDLKYAKTIFVNLSTAMDDDRFKDRLRAGRDSALKVLNQLLL